MFDQYNTWHEFAAEFNLIFFAIIIEKVFHF